MPESSVDTLTCCSLCTPFWKGKFAYFTLCKPKPNVTGAQYFTALYKMMPSTGIETITPITHVQLILDLNIHQIPESYLFTRVFNCALFAIVKKIAKLRPAN